MKKAMNSTAGKIGTTLALAFVAFALGNRLVRHSRPARKLLTGI